MTQISFRKGVEEVERWAEVSGTRVVMIMEAGRMRGRVAAGEVVGYSV
jgi:hypothetical protein